MHEAPSPHEAYDAAFGFWRRLAQRYVPVGESRALVNTDAPFVFANALWYPNADTVLGALPLYAEAGVLASAAVPETPDAALREALERAGFVRSSVHTLRPPEPIGSETLVTETSSDTVTEQVSWAQARSLGEVIAAVYDVGPYAVAVGQALTLAMQLDVKVEAFIAYDAKPVGASVTLETKGALTAFLLEALTDEARTALTARLSFEAETRGKRALRFSQVVSHPSGGGLEVWTQTCS